MPIQAPSWTDFLFCPICCNEFAVNQRLPISLGCGHTICRQCLSTLHNRQCPFDQTSITTDVDNLPVNNALLQLVSTNNTNTNNNSNNPGNNNNNNNGSGIDSGSVSAGSDGDSNAIARHTPPSVRQLNPEDLNSYNLSNKCIESLALYLKSLVTNNGNFGSPLSRPMQRKLVTLVNTQLMEREGRERVLRAARSLGERTVTELILQHQNPQQLSSNLWAAVRSRGCQFLGPAMQEEVLKLVLQALEDGTAYSRKVLVMYVVQRLEPRFPQASKTSIGHVVQLLYRASCFKVSKREADSSLMQLKEEFRTYDALRREHDAQIVQIATEAGLRIAPDQWSSLLYGDTIHKSHMQSIIDKLQTPSSFAQSVQELVIALQRTGDPANLSGLRTHLKHLAGIDPSLESPPPSWQDVAKALEAVHEVVVGLVGFVQHHGNRKLQECNTGQATTNSKYKISLCRDLTVRRNCPRGSSCTFAHSEEELEKYRAKNRSKTTKHGGSGLNSGISVINSGGGAVVNNINNVKNDFITHNHAHSHRGHGHSHGGHGHSHAGHNPTHPPITMLRPGNDNSTPVSVSTSPLRFGGPPPPPLPPSNMHNKLQRASYVDASSSLQAHGGPPHHHLLTLHHSPIQPNSGQTLSVPTQAHRYDTPTFGNPLNYPIPTSVGLPQRMPQGLANVTNASVAMSNSSGGVLSPRNFPTNFQPPLSTQHAPLPQPPPPPNLATNNPPKYHNNNNNVATTFGSSISNKGGGGIYNVLPPEFYNSSVSSRVACARASSLFSNNHNNSSSGAALGDTGAGINAKNELKVNIGQPTEKIRHYPVHLANMWEQKQLGGGGTSAVGDILSAIGDGSLAQQPTTLYSSNDPSPTFGKKVNNVVSMDLNKTLNGLGIGDSYIFRNDFSVSANTVLPPQIPNNKNNLVGGGDLQSRQKSFWHSHNNNISVEAGTFADNTQQQERNSMAHTMGVNSPVPFRDRDSFVRSDSILDDDAATFEVPATSADMGNKFGPICPMYKGHTHSSTAIDASNTTNTYTDSWCSGDVRNPTANHEQHPLLERNMSGGIHYSVFSTNDTENSLALQFRQQLQRSANVQQQFQQQQRQRQNHQAQQSHRSFVFDNFNCLQNSLIPDLPFNHLSNLSRDRESGCGSSSATVDGTANFELGFNAFQNMLAGADDNGYNGINKTSSMWNTSGLKTIDTNFWNDALAAATTKSKELQIQLQQQRQQQQYRQQFANIGRNSEENTIDSGRMRDIEQELSEIVDKSWSNADDSGIKL
ncbi:roquin-2 [Eurosta solidaginis]|uniref:roquin-2 n=1 Tax=Eurosta solidaginis TaxID=178769 RepID=UPI003530A0D4